jgi:predicted Zn-ribbon and HTH transcriptional regulator
MLAKETDEEQRAAPDVKFAGRKPKPKAAARPTTAGLLRDLTDEQKFAIVVRDLRQINRAAAREGKKVVIVDARTNDEGRLF